MGFYRGGFLFGERDVPHRDVLLYLFELSAGILLVPPKEKALRDTFATDSDTVLPIGVFL